MNCKYYRTRTKKGIKYGYCTKYKKEVTLFCKECKKNIEYKCTINQKYCAKLRNKTGKLAKIERNRTSLFTNDLEHCIICAQSPVNKHEIFFGRNRQNSIKYKLVIPLCVKEHHNQLEQKGIHFDTKLCDEWHVKGQLKFEECYPNLDFISIFHRNYK